MVYCDKNDAVIQWQSEEIAIPYKSPVDGKWHRYYPDFMIKYKDATGKIRKVMVEVKPDKQCKQPEINPPRKTKTWLNEVYTWGTNQVPSGKQQENTVRIDSGNSRSLPKKS